MTLDETIKHAEEVAEEHTKYNRYGGFESCDECAKEHRQLARWLKELKQLREQEPEIYVVDKIREEIEEVVLESLSDDGDDWFAAEKVNECLDIIDKYKSEREVNNNGR